MVTFPDVDSRPKLWEVKISDRNLLHLLKIKEFFGSQRDYNYSDSNDPTPDDIDSVQHSDENDSNIKDGPNSSRYQCH